MQKRKHDKFDPAQGVNGFVVIECKACGRVQYTFLKESITQYQCICRHKTGVMDVKPLYAHCECGENWRYWTNWTKEQITVNCRKCGYPIETELNGRGTAYVTMR